MKIYNTAKNTAPHPDEILSDSAFKNELPVCDHYVGNPKFYAKALSIRQTLGPVFDITLDLEDGTAVGEETQAAQWASSLVQAFSHDQRGLGIRIHALDHPAFNNDLDEILQKPTKHLAYLMLPKANNLEDIQIVLSEISRRCQNNGWPNPPPLHALIETPGAIADVDKIAALEQIESLSFGIMDFVSHFKGLIPATAMKSPLQFEHPLVTRAKVDIVMACHRHNKTPSHNVCTDFKSTKQVEHDALCAKEHFGFSRMWSIHPTQIEPIVKCFQPQAHLLDQACSILIQAHQTNWGPIQHHGVLHDRASFRYHWAIVKQAYNTGAQLPEIIQLWCETTFLFE